MSKIIGISFFVELFITLFFLENYFSLKYNLKRIITKIDVSENKIQFTLLSNDVLILDENFKFKLFNKEGGFIERSLSFYSKNTLLSNPFNKANIKTYIIDAGIKLYVYPEFYKSPEDVYDFIKQFAEENFDWN